MPGDEAKQVAILAWHKIGAPVPGGWDTWNYVAEDIFLAQLRTLKDLGFEVVDLDAFLRGLAEPEILPRRSALLTFDDGYQSMLTVAQPCLQKADLPSVLFVPTDYVGKTNMFDEGNEPTEPICTWNELRELQKRGVAVQSHGVTHTAFSDLGSEQQTEELARSKMLLEDELGTPVQAFAYPYGDPGQDEATASIFRELGYRTAMLYKGGPATIPTSEPFQMTRIAVGPDTNLARNLGGAA